MLRCTLFKDYFLIATQWTSSSTNSCFVCSNTYNLHTCGFVKNIVSSFWNMKKNLSYINICQKTYWETCMFYWAGIWKC